MSGGHSYKLPQQTVRSYTPALGSYKTAENTNTQLVLVHSHRSLSKVLANPHRVARLIDDCGIGSAISWFGAKDPNGGLASVTLDDGPATTVDVSAGMSPGENVQLAALYSKTGLERDGEHTIVVTWAGDSQGIYITIYNFQ